MHRFLLHNGEIRESSERLACFGQVGLLSGWGVFSTIRIYDGVVFAWERHWSRMGSDARRLRVPFPLERDAAEEELGRLIEANQAWNATMRIAIVRNNGGIWGGPPTRDCDVIALTAPVYPWRENLLGGDGLKLGLIPHGRHAANEFAGAKILSWAQNLAVYERAHEQGYDEVVLLNERGEVAECTSGNIFAVYGDRVLTPPLSSGCLPGVTRAILLEEIRTPEFQIQEKVLVPSDLESADEVLISSTTRELLPAASIEGLRIGRGRGAGERLLEAFGAYVRRYVAAKRSSSLSAPISAFN
ncbi:MAG TPA: aminotransferase class IV [Bryobacteraceae bacterium]|nr:aminotransferase class IV [Bryobacteraceae bacterium]